MAEENENQEPKEGEEEQSMDEILGSIREILSDEDQENQPESNMVEDPIAQKATEAAQDAVDRVDAAFNQAEE